MFVFFFCSLHTFFYRRLLIEADFNYLLHEHCLKLGDKSSTTSCQLDRWFVKAMAGSLKNWRERYFKLFPQKITFNEMLHKAFSLQVNVVESFSSISLVLIPNPNPNLSAKVRQTPFYTGQRLANYTFSICSVCTCVHVSSSRSICVEFVTSVSVMKQS